ncbi:hypothetical protein [Vibrio scophthalmi]|uniref:Uncharacterized protein n=1 Tax=Vibrio scophthalmi TaxID=45658 RepID=A0A1E3WHC0_9VIBR|nr:hypothetical protein [Vibrio scophthalmi]ODS05196.1 hypothetical protein VSF3289_04337 [Vibrio scophthalmi]
MHIRAHYYPIDKQTKEVLDAVEPEYRGGISHIPRDALRNEPLPFKHGFVVVAVLDESGLAISSEYREDHRGATIWLKSNCKQSKQVVELGAIEDGWTLLEPHTMYDYWVVDAWITDVSVQYIDQYNQVDDTRRYLYSQMSDPLYFESDREKRQGNHDIANELEEQADAAVAKIKHENPFPIAPYN